MKEALFALRDYQDILSRIAELDKLLAFIPQEIQDLEAEWRSIQKRMEELSEKKTGLDAKLKELNTQLEEVNTKAQKYEKDLHEVTNNKEYHAVLKEIDTAKKKQHQLTEEIAKIKKELEEIETTTADLTKQEAEAKEKFDTEMSAHEGQQAENRTERNKLEKDRREVADKIPLELMSKFERIARRRAGVGLALCISNICNACHVRVRAALVEELRHHTRIINCDSCKRILFFAEEG